MTSPEIITIPAGTMINRSGHEDDDFQILEADVTATVLGPAANHAIPVRIDVIDPDQIFFLHQPEKSASE